MFTKILIGACIVAVARAGLLAEPALATAYAAPAAYASYSGYSPASYVGYSRPATYTSYAAPAYASHGYGYGSYYNDQAIAHTSENTYRSAGNLHSVSTQSRTIASPYFSSSKQFTKFSKPGIYAHAAPIAIAHHGTYAAPIAHAAPLAIAAPIAHHATIATAPVAHAALATTYASHHGALGYAAGHSYGHSAHSASLLGTAYSPAIGASHVSYDSPIGIHYGY